MSISPLSAGATHSPELCRLCPCYHSLCKFICVSLLLCLKDLTPLVPSVPSGFYDPSTSSSTRFFEPRGERFYGETPSMTKCSKLSHSPPSVKLWVSVFVPFTASLMKAKQGTDLWVLQNVISNHFMATFQEQ